MIIQPTNTALLFVHPCGCSRKTGNGGISEIQKDRRMGGIAMFCIVRRACEVLPEAKRDGLWLILGKCSKANASASEINEWWKRVKTAEV